MLALWAICAVTVFAVATGAAAAEWPNTPSVSCDRIVIDPPTWIKVTFTGTINGEPFERTAFYGGDGSHDAHIDIGDLTAAVGTANVVVTATSGFLGTSHTARVTINCPATVEGSDKGTDGAAGASADDPGANANASKVAGTQASRDGLLPFTGGYALRLALIGFGTLAIGLGASRVRRRRHIGRGPRDE